jgi:hypothetical protein
VREEAEVNAMLAVSSIKGGIRVGAHKGKRGTAADTEAKPGSESDTTREPALSR